MGENKKIAAYKYINRLNIETIEQTPGLLHTHLLQLNSLKKRVSTTPTAAK